MIPYRLLPSAAGLVLLAACGDKAEPQEGSVQGEVLEGTISDAMVPVDQVKSQAPLAGGGGEESPDEENGPAAARTSVFAGSSSDRKINSPVAPNETWSALRAIKRAGVRRSTGERQTSRSPVAFLAVYATSVESREMS